MHENEDFLNNTSNKVKYDPMIFKFSVSMGNIVNFDEQKKLFLSLFGPFYGIFYPKNDLNLGPCNKSTY